MQLCMYLALELSPLKGANEKTIYIKVLISIHILNSQALFFTIMFYIKLYRAVGLLNLDLNSDNYFMSYFPI